jgi:hypothetical protein
MANGVHETAVFARIATCARPHDTTLLPRTDKEVRPEPSGLASGLSAKGSRYREQFLILREVAKAGYLGPSDNTVRVHEELPDRMVIASSLSRSSSCDISSG